MKIIVDRSALLEAVNLVSAVVPARSPSPALSCVKLVASVQGGVGSLRVSGTDAETSLELVLSRVDVAQAGTAVVSGEKLRQIVGNLSEADPTITLELDGDQCHIRGSSSKFKIFAVPSTDYPPFPDFHAAVSGSGPQAARAVFSHQAGGLLRLINRTVFAVARETSRYAINGVYLKRDGKKLEMVATDGRRLAMCRTSVKAAPETASVACIVPTKALQLLTRLVSDPEETIRVALTENRIFFSVEAPLEGAAKGKKGDAAAGGATGGAGGAGGATEPRAVLSSTLVEGAFPPYEDVIPKDQDKRATAGRDEFASAVRQASVLTNEESRGIRMAFSGKTKRVTLSSRAPEMGESEIDLGLSGYDGEDVEICFNPAFFSDVLKTIDEPEVVVELKAPNKPGVLKAGADFVYVLMPVNLPT
jgi:DNA polymerase-3 subunit beta